MLELPIANPFAEPPGAPLQIAVHEVPETITGFLRKHRVWQRPLTVFLETMLRPGDLVVDVGANIGYFSIIAAATVGPTGGVHSYEPEPANFALLERSRELNRLANLRCHRLAVADRAGTATLYRSPGNRGAHSLLAGRGEAPLEVPVVTLDAHLAEERRPIRLVKIDVQGADLQVLLGMAGLVERQDRKPWIIMEFCPRDLQACDPGLARLEGFIARFGYQVYGFIANERMSAVPPRIGVATLRALHEDFLRFGEDAEFDILLARPQGKAGSG